MCKALNISESGYYRWLKNKDKSTKQQLLLVEIRKVLKEYPDNDNYGSRRMHTALAQRGIHVSVRTVVPKTLDIAGDGTCIKTKASPVGRRVCNCKDNGVFNCSCGRRFSDPNAAWGWDSSKEVYFYGYMGYFLSTYNNDLKLDLPLYFRIVDARRNDSVSAVVALQEFRELYPYLKVDSFLSDVSVVTQDHPNALAICGMSLEVSMPCGHILSQLLHFLQASAPFSSFLYIAFALSPPITGI